MGVDQVLRLAIRLPDVDQIARRGRTQPGRARTLDDTVVPDSTDRESRVFEHLLEPLVMVIVRVGDDAGMDRGGFGKVLEPPGQEPGHVGPLAGIHDQNARIGMVAGFGQDGPVALTDIQKDDFKHPVLAQVLGPHDIGLRAEPDRRPAIARVRPGHPNPVAPQQLLDLRAADLPRRLRRLIPPKKRHRPFRIPDHARPFPAPVFGWRFQLDQSYPKTGLNAWVTRLTACPFPCISPA